MKPIVLIKYCGTDYFRPGADQYCIRLRQDLDIVLEYQILKKKLKKINFW